MIEWLEKDKWKWTHDRYLFSINNLNVFLFDGTVMRFEDTMAELRKNNFVIINEIEVEDVYHFNDIRIPYDSIKYIECNGRIICFNGDDE